MGISGKNAQEIIKALKEASSNEVLNEILEANFIPFELEDYFSNLENKSELEYKILSQIKEQHRIIGTGYNKINVDINYCSDPLWINGASWDCGESMRLPLLLQQDLKNGRKFMKKN